MLMLPGMRSWVAADDSRVMRKSKNSEYPQASNGRVGEHRTLAQVGPESRS